MTLKIIHKHGTTAGTPPVAGDIDVGELSINAADAELYIKDTSGNIREFRNKDLTTAEITEATTFTQGGTGAVERTFKNKSRDLPFVDDFIPVGTDTATTNCSSYVQAAFDAIQANGGGTVHFDGSKTYLICASQTGRGFGGTGGYIDKNTHVEGNMAKIIFNPRDSVGGTIQSGPACFRVQSNAQGTLELTGTLNAGTFDYTVTDASAASVGDEVFVRVVDNAYDSVEAKYYYSAVITAIVGNTVTLSMPVPETFDAASQTLANRKVILLGANGLTGTNSFSNFRFEMSGGETSEDQCAIEFRETKGGRVYNIELDNTFIRFRACEGAYAKGVKSKYHRASVSGSKGWAFNIVNCVGFALEDLYTEAFQQSVLQLESYSSGKVSNVTAVNNLFSEFGIEPTVNTANNYGVFKLIQESTITELNNLTISGSQGSLSSTPGPNIDGALNLRNASNGGKILSIRNVSVRTAGTPALNLGLGFSSGMFNDVASGTSSNLDNSYTVEKTITFAGSETGSTTYYNAVPRNCLILGVSYVIENEPSNIANYSSLRLIFEDASGTVKTPSQYQLSPVAADTIYRISKDTLLYSPTGILGSINYNYSTERRLVVVFSGGSPSAGARLVCRYQISHVSGVTPTHMNSQPTD